VAAITAKLRFRAVVMTSLAFILGLVPLVWASGASAVPRHHVSTPVFAGMIAWRPVIPPHCGIKHLAGRAASCRRNRPRSGSA
jgi:hypothetical protein